MKKREHKLISIIVILVILLIGTNIKLIFNQNTVLTNGRQIIKEMDEGKQISSLNSTINELNKSHTDYENYIKTCKTQIATALTNEGVTTSSEEKLETMASNISKVLQSRTSDATATAEDILKDKTAYVNGNLIIGNANEKSYEILWENQNPTQTISSFSVECADVTKYEKIIICFMPYTNQLYADRLLIDESSGFTQTMYVKYTSDSATIGSRTVTLNGNVFKFSNGYFSNVGHGSNEATVVPRWIMGINMD